MRETSSPSQPRGLEPRRWRRAPGGPAPGPLARPWGQACARLILIGLLIASVLHSQAAEPAISEYQVKAAFLYNFAKFADWPEAKLGTAASPMVIGILGEDPFGAMLDTLVQGKSVNGHPLKVRRLPSAENAGECHILFISRSEQSKLGALLEPLKSLPILTVSEVDRFAQQGGVIRFILVNETVRLEINPGAAEKAGLKIKSNLLSLARIVTTDKAP
jgi:hypothetical protein